jgi:hypothetical protein
MKKTAIVAISGTMGFLLGILAHSQLAARPGTMGRETGRGAVASSERPGPASTTVRLEPIPSAGDSREADLVLQKQGRTSRRWPLGSIWMDDWGQVPVNRIAVGNTQTWWVSWRVGSGTGLSQHDGAVVWFPERCEPAFWQGTWTRTESFLDGVGYEYEYSTELWARPNDEARIRLHVQVRGESNQDGKLFEFFLCVPRRMADGRWVFVVDDGYRQTVNRLLGVGYLEGVHDQLRCFLPAE